MKEEATKKLHDEVSDEYAPLAFVFTSQPVTEQYLKADSVGFQTVSSAEIVENRRYPAACWHLVAITTVYFCVAQLTSLTRAIAVVFSKEAVIVNSEGGRTWAGGGGGGGGEGWRAEWSVHLLCTKRCITDVN